jgi:glycogen operon protein
MTTNYQLCSEKPYPLGCYIDYDRSLVVRSEFQENKRCGLVLYPAKGSRKKPLTIELPKSVRRGRIYSARIRGIEDLADYESYNYFSDDEFFCDPYAKQIFGLETFGKNVPDADIRAKLDNKADRKTSKHVFDWEHDPHDFIPYEDSFIYLLHVRGFTKSSSSGVPTGDRGTFAGIIDKIPYLKSLGVTAVELMPAYEMNEVEDPYRKSDRRSLNKAGSEDLVYSRNGSITSQKAQDFKLNFWGYKKGYYFAPRTAYCRNPQDSENEFKSFIKTMHQNGLEVIMQFYFDEDESGTLIIDALRFWRCTYHVDGFHLKGSKIPVDLIVNEPLFTEVKIFNDWFDYGAIYKGSNPPLRLLADYNKAFMYNSRRFLKSDDNSTNDFLKSMIANFSDHSVVNYLSDYEGFRLMDLVSYEHKHNEENGENNKDGTDNNLSWNCGIEGRTRKQDILALRTKQIKNALTMLFFSQGVPMIFSGDEFGNSQNGNNNPYCQDNETGWIDWKAMDKNPEILDYVKFLSGLRYGNRIIHTDKPFKLMDYISCGYPDLSCHGREAWRPDLSGHSHLLGMLFCGLYDESAQGKPFIYVSFNMHWTRQELALPGLPEGLKWELLSDTDKRDIKKEVRRSRPSKDSAEPSENRDVFTELMAERSVRIYVSCVDPSYTKKKKKVTGKK